jgi:phage-related minor tail protein
MADSPDVKLQITAEEKGVSTAIQELTAQLQGLKTQEAETAESSLNLAEAFEGLLAVLAVEKIVEFGKEVFDTTTNILKLSQVTGLSTETLSVYAAAATHAGVSFDVVGGAITQLAKVVTQFEQGNQRAAKAIALTGLSLKDLEGLNSEQKIRTITDAIARMPPGFAKATAESKLLGDSSGNLNRVLSQLAGDGFEKTREEAEKLGTIVGTQTAQDFESLRASLASMKETAEGMVLQFESGIVPSLTDIANAILRVTTDGASGFKGFGEAAGGVLKFLVLAAAELFGGIEKLANRVIDNSKNLATAASDILHVGVAQAAKNFADNEAASQKFMDDLVDAQLTAVRTELDGTTRLQEDAIAKQKAQRDAAAAKAKGDAGIANEEAIKGLIKLQEQQDAAFKARTTALNKASQAEESISKATQAEGEERSKSDYERGLQTLSEYFDQRRIDVEIAGKNELAALQEQRENEVKAEARAAAEKRANQAASTKAGGSSTLIGQEYGGAAAKDAAEQARAQQAIADLDTKIAVQTLANKGKLTAEDLDRYKAEAEQLTKLAEFQKTILDIQGKTAQAAQAESAAKVAEYRLLLTSQKGETPESIELKVQKYVELTTAVAAYNDAKKAGETALKAQSDAEAAIQLKVASGQIFQIQADAQIKALKRDQLALLQQIATAQLAAANATGNDADKQAALNFQAQINAQAVANDQAMAQAKELKQGLQDALSNSLDAFFSKGITGARDMGQAFAGLADGVVSSLQKVAAQMLTNLIMQKLFNAAASGIGGMSGGGSVSGGGGMGVFAEGGQVTGPGTATSDSIPAMLSAGEFVFREAAVRAIGPGVLEAMNRGLRVPSFTGASIPKFAEGGLVEGTGRGNDPALVHLQLGLEEGIVLKHMKSNAAGKVVVQHLANNPKTASKALGRSK